MPRSDKLFIDNEPDIEFARALVARIARRQKAQCRGVVCDPVSRRQRDVFETEVDTAGSVFHLDHHEVLKGFTALRLLIGMTELVSAGGSGFCWATTASMPGFCAEAY